MTADTIHGSTARERLLWISRAVTYVVYAYFLICEIILFLGFILRLFGASPQADFVEFVYRSLERVMSPFRGIFAPIELGTTANDVPAVLDTSILFAMIVYAIVLLFLRELIDWLTLRLLRAQHEQMRPVAADPVGTAVPSAYNVPPSAAEPLRPAGWTPDVYPPTPPPPSPPR